MIKIKTEELVKLKEQGMTYAEIAEHFTSQGRKISHDTVRTRLIKYYDNQGKTIPKAKREIDISDMELVSLREEGKTYLEIAQYFTNQGKSVSIATINKRIKQYYEMLGEEDPLLRHKISDRELVELKEIGLSDKEIAEHFANEGRKISQFTVGKRLIIYYRNQGKIKPRPKRKREISDEELVNLRETGFSNRRIAEYFTSQGRKISHDTVRTRLIKYYDNQGKTIPKAKREIDIISDEELVKLRETGFSNRRIAEYFTSQGRKISRSTVRRKLINYYNKQGKSIPEAKRKNYISDEELVTLREQGMTYIEIAEYFTNQGKFVTSTTVNKRIKQYYEKYGEPPKKRERKYEDDLKEILMQGITAQEFISEFGNEEIKKPLEKKLEKLKVIAEHSKKINNNWITDNDFINLIKVIQDSSDDIKKYEDYTNTYVCDGICNKGQIDTIKDKVFNGNTDLMMYVVSRLNIEYYRGYDMRIYRSLNKQYKEKVDNYLNRLYSIEKNRKNKLNSENNNNLILEEEER